MQDETVKTVKIVFFGEIIEVPKQEPLDGEAYELLVKALYENSKKKSKIKGML